VKKAVYWGIVAIALAAAGAYGEEPQKFHASIDVAAGYAIPYIDDFNAGQAPGMMVTYSFLLSERNALGITLLRFNMHPFAANTLYTFAYGFNFRHYWPASWATLDPFVPYLSYSILLSQAILSGTSGRAIAHDTRIALGTDIKIAQRHRLTLEAAWDYASYPYFNTVTKGIQFITPSIGYRFLF
jgi:hypothetical protein